VYNNAPRYPATADRYRTHCNVFGTVSRNVAGNRFDIITDAGATVRVRARVGEPAGLSANDRVQLSGQMVNNIFVAESVRVTRNTGNAVTLRGTVVTVISSTEFTMRADNGRVVTVVARAPFSSTITAGDRVRVPGTQSGDYVRASRVVMVRDTVSVPNGQNVDFRGTVVNVNRAGRTLQVRGENNVVYVVRYYGATDFRVGDRVRVVGNSFESVTSATSVTRR
jgi:uncharacterized protein YdeI (BOF family)